MGWLPFRFSSTVISVESPVFVFLCGFRPSFSNSTFDSSRVEFMLKGCPAASWIFPSTSSSISLFFASIFLK